MQVSIPRVMVFVALAVLLGVSPAHPQKGGGLQADFKPTLGQKVDARSSPAKATGEEASALAGKGYVQIGTISALQPGKKADPKITKRLESAILQKAAEAGGDVVRFSKEGASETIHLSTGKQKVKGGYCAQYEAVSTSVSTPSTSCYTDIHGFQHCSTTNTPGYKTSQRCVKWAGGEAAPITKTVENLVSEGTVWRNDPKLVADIAARAATAEAAREAAVADQKAAAAAQRAKEAQEHASLMEKILNGALSPDANRDEKGLTLLHRAAEHGSKDEAELLLAKGADVNARDIEGSTPIVYAATNRHTDMAELLLAHGADANARINLGWTILHGAAIQGNTDLAELLLAHGADANAKDQFGQTPLHYAALWGQKGVAELLLAKGADVNASSIWNQTPLHIALESFNGTNAVGRTKSPSEFKDALDLLRQHGGHE